MIEMIIKLLAGHFIADVILQDDRVNNNKNPNTKIPVGYDPEKHGPMQVVWPFFMLAHCATHGAMVYLVTGRMGLAVGETVHHFMVDYFKCKNKFGIYTDQMLHIGNKIVIALIMYNYI